MMRFVDAIAYQAQLRADAPALIFPDRRDGELDYGSLLRAVDGIAERLLSQELPKGSLLAVHCQDKLVHALLLVACARCGFPTASTDLKQAVALSNVRAILTDLPGLNAAPRAIVVSPDWLAPRTRDLAYPELAESDLCRVMLTSGSTGRPKPIALTYAMVEARLDAFPHVFGPDFAAVMRMMCVMPLSSSLGFAFLFYLLARGGLFCGESLDFGEIARRLALHSIEALVTSPYSLAELIAARRTQALPRIPIVLTAGARLAPSLAQSVRAAFADRLISFYGTTEVGVIAADCGGQEDAANIGLRVVPGRRVAVVGADGGALPGGEVGLIEISTPPETLPFLDRFDPGSDNRTWRFRPGDLGVFGPNGLLNIVGREDNVLNVGGTKLLAEDLEQRIGAASGVLDCALALKTDELGIDRIACALVLGSRWSQESFETYCRTNVPSDFLPSKFVILTAIPRTLNHKIDRAALAKLLD